MDTLLDVQNVCLSYHTLEGETRALSNISFQVKQGEFLAIVGPSGCGKSTLLDLICHLLTPESGTITLKSATGGKDEAKIGYMLQKDHLLEWRSVYQNVILGLEIRHPLHPGRRPHRDPMPKQGRENLPRNRRQRSGHRARRARARFRPLLPRARHENLGHGARPCHREANRRHSPRQDRHRRRPRRTRNDLPTRLPAARHEVERRALSPSFLLQI